MNNTGRRVKLDLFAEPSGDLGGSSAHDEVGVDTDLKHRAGLPNSPSSSVCLLSSGQKPENPLLLLGQYSDDELEDDSEKALDNAAVESSSPGNNDEGVVLHGEASVDIEVNTGEVQHEIDKDSTSLNYQNQEGMDKRESDAAASSDLCKDLETEQVSTSGASDAQLLGDVSSGWQIVMHEESNRYYYWNTETGETSWEIPEVLAQVSELGGNHKTPVMSERIEDISVNTQEPNLSSGVTLENLSAATGIDGLHPVVWNGGVNNEVQNDAIQSNDVINSGSFNDTLGDGNCDLQIDLSSSLIKHCETLLETLKSVKGSKGELQSPDCFSKYILEVEIRLSDIRTLSSFGSSLHQFWVHSERQLKRLEDAINVEIYKIAESTVLGDKLQESKVHESEPYGTGKIALFPLSENTHFTPVNASPCMYVESSSGDQVNGAARPDELIPKHESNSVEDVDMDAPKQLKQLEDAINVEIYKIAESTVLGDKLQESKVHESEPYGTGKIALFPLSENIHFTPVNASPYMYVESSYGDQVNGAARPDELIPKHESNSVEDVDMDVDMEVEDATSAGDTAIADESRLKEFAAPEQSNQPIQPAGHTSIDSQDAFAVPPPPDEEWIPPPPPDNEQIPPPPPDELPEPVYHLPTSYLETVPPAPYAEQYNLSYPNSGFEYYGHAATDAQSSNFYGNAEGCQVAVPQAPIYYNAVPNPYTETSQITANPIVPVAYYELQDGVPPAPGTTITESSQFHRKPTPISYETLASDRMASVEAGSNTFTTEKGGRSAIGGEMDMASKEALPTTATIQAPAAVPAEDSVAVPSTNAIPAIAAVSATSTVTKAQSKVARTKKRTVAVASSLRSSKKVSSLVNKWKAAKEELLEDEEEPKNAYEMLERKRQREIEEWHAQQIASGEAKDNANFQPLGGDWRERVKRRRAQQAREAARTSPEAHNDENQEQQHQQQPNLAELSKDLPSGWQAYWDESSKQVYYGNVVTSETTWTRPTK
ncbi:Formin-binding protein 4 [Morus notabilis]|uniref:Formin-binding protein 4 n=1 Tax=Morus notabilis TaxID=981085 RepID=W9RVD8_9ROSA|nr:Formin-binding protein 4 [Morus notabilis]